MALIDKVKVKKTISLDLTAEDWQLYTIIPGAAIAASQLNNCIESAVNAGLSEREVYRNAYEQMRALSKFGATDTEPMWVLEKLLKLIYGDSNE